MDDKAGEEKKHLPAFTSTDTGYSSYSNDLATHDASIGALFPDSCPNKGIGSGEQEEEAEGLEPEAFGSLSMGAPQVQTSQDGAVGEDDEEETREVGQSLRKDAGEELEEEDEEEDGDSDKDEATERDGEVDDELYRKDTGKEPKMNGESGSRNFGSGKRGRFRNSGSFSSSISGDQAYTTPSSSYNKPSLSSSGGGRHKQARRRNHHHPHQQGRHRRRTGSQLILAVREVLSESVSPWCMSCIHMMVDLIVSVAHYCGLAVESGCLVTYDLSARFLFRMTDLPGLKQDARRGMAWARCSCTSMVGWTRQTMGRVCQTCASCFSLFCVLAMLAARAAHSALGRLSGGRCQQWWETCQNSWVGRKVAALLKLCGTVLRRGRSRGPGPSPESPSGARGLPGQELERLLSLAQVPEDELDPFAVLGVETNATEAELKRAYRQLAVQVHPDKNKHPRAGEAFKVLRAAWDIVSNPETRREYELKRMAATELSKSMNEFLTKLQDDLREAMNTMMCTKCEGKHKRFEMDREPSEARFCAECNRHHSAEEGDLWAESSMLGLRITYFAFMDGKVYDITEWAGCQRIGISPDTHRVPYHISFGSKTNSNTNRHRPSEHAPGPSSPADLQDLFNRIFQGGGPPADMGANGGFFPSGSPPPHPQGPGMGPAGAGGAFSGPSSSPQTGFFPQGPHRAESGEQWTEGGKQTRRRKKVRKPFQR